MAENQTNTNRLVMILAAAVVVLFVAFIAVVLVTTSSKSSTTASTASTTGTSTTASTASTTAVTNEGMSSSTNFDASTATKVPSGTAPKDFVAKYYQSILDKKWSTAFKMQPAASQQGATVSGFQQTQETYGMTAFSVFSSTVGSTEATVVIEQNLGTNGTWNATWTFVKNGGDWLVKERKVGMGAPTK
jgi:hypothetical protein